MPWITGPDGQPVWQAEGESRFPFGDFTEGLRRRLTDPRNIHSPFRQDAAPAPVPETETLIPRPELPAPIPAPNFSAQPTLDMGPDAPLIAPPPQRTVDPALSERRDFMAGREQRTGRMFDEYLAGLRQDDPSARPWWARLADIGGRVAATGDLSQAGVATSGYFQDERNARNQIREAAMRLGLSREDLMGDTAEAGFAVTSGQHGVAEDNANSAYSVDNQNRQNQFNVGQSRANIRNSAAQQSAATERELAMAEYQRLLAQYQVLMTLGGAGGLDAANASLGNLPEGMRQGADQTLRRQGLENIITQEAAGARNANAGRRAIHARMVALAGRDIPQPPRNLTDPAALARYYIQQGVNLNNPAVAEAFPGIGRPE